MPKRILAVSHYYVTDNRGGGEVYLREVCKALVNAGCEVDAVAVDTKAPSEVLDGVRVFKGKQHADMLSKKYDLVITQFAQADRILPMAQKLKIPSVYIVHNDMETTIKTLANNIPDLTVFNTRWIRDKFKYRNNHYILPPPVFMKDHQTTPGDLISFINLIEIKGVNAFYNIALSLPRTKFLAVKGGYGKERQVLIQRPNIEFIENTSNMKDDVWSRTKILLVPSIYETYGMVAVEALCSGIPVIARPQEGLKEALGIAGRYPRDNSVGAWKHEIVKLQHPEVYRQASEVALKRARQLTPEKDLEGLVERIMELM